MEGCGGGITVRARTCVWVPVGPGNTQRGPTVSAYTHGWVAVREGLQEDVSELSPDDGQKLPKVHWQVGQRWFTNYLGCTGGRTRVVHELPGCMGRWGRRAGHSGLGCPKPLIWTLF